MKEYIVQIAAEDRKIQSGLFTAEDPIHAKEQALMIWPGIVIGVYERIE